MRAHPCSAVLALVLAVGTPAQEDVRSLAALQRSAAILYGSGEFAEALAEVDRGLAVAPDDEKLLTLGAWCQLRRVEADAAHIGRAAAWFAELRRGRELKDLGEHVILGIGRCQRELANVCPADQRRRLLEDAELSFSELIRRQEQLPHALRDRSEVRLALGDTEAAIEDASDYERSVSGICAGIEDRLRATALEDYRKDLRSRLARRRGDLDGVRAMLALHRWANGDRDEVRWLVQALLSREAPPFDQPDVAELLVTVAPDDPRVLPALVFRLARAREAAARLAAAVALGELGEKSRDAVPALVVATADPSGEVAREAITALGMIGPGAADAILTLQALAGSDDEPMRRRAAAALRQIQR